MNIKSNLSVLVLLYFVFICSCENNYRRPKRKRNQSGNLTSVTTTPTQNHPPTLGEQEIAKRSIENTTITRDPIEKVTNQNQNPKEGEPTKTDDIQPNERSIEEQSNDVQRQTEDLNLRQDEKQSHSSVTDRSNEDNIDRADNEEDIIFEEKPKEEDEYIPIQEKKGLTENYIPESYLPQKSSQPAKLISDQDNKTEKQKTKESEDSNDGSHEANTQDTQKDSIEKMEEEVLRKKNETINTLRKKLDYYLKKYSEFDEMGTFFEENLKSTFQCKEKITKNIPDINNSDSKTKLALKQIELMQAEVKKLRDSLNKYQNLQQYEESLKTIEGNRNIHHIPLELKQYITIQCIGLRGEVSTLKEQCKRIWRYANTQNSNLKVINKELNQVRLSGRNIDVDDFPNINLSGLYKKIEAIQVPDIEVDNNKYPY